MMVVPQTDGVNGVGTCPLPASQRDDHGTLCRNRPVVGTIERVAGAPDFGAINITNVGNIRFWLRFILRKRCGTNFGRRALAGSRMSNPLHQGSAPGKRDLPQKERAIMANTGKGWLVEKRERSAKKFFWFKSGNYSKEPATVSSGSASNQLIGFPHAARLI